MRNVEITECPTALERDLNPPNTSQCPLLPHSLWDRPLYFSFSRKFASLLVLIRCMPGFSSTVSLQITQTRVDLQLEVCMGGFSHLGRRSDFMGVRYRLSIPTGNLKLVCKKQPLHTVFLCSSGRPFSRNTCKANFQ